MDFTDLLYYNIDMKIGLGVITCDRQQFLKRCLASINPTLVHEICIVNDGNESVDDITGDIYTIQQWPPRQSVGVAKNTALKYLMKRDCDHFFLIEEDTVILDGNVFMKYIEASKASGIQHFNFGPGSGLNRKQPDQDKYNQYIDRESWEMKTEPIPRLVVEFAKDINVSLFPHCCGMFSYYTKKCLDVAGLFDEKFRNVWEHVEHTHQIIKHGLHPPFWYFADIKDSHLYLAEQKDAIKESSISGDKEAWKTNLESGAKYYAEKHGAAPMQIPVESRNVVLDSLRKIKKLHG